jgi:hypothetical protein
MATTVRFLEPAAHFEELLATEIPEGQRLGADWPPNTIAWVQHNWPIYSDGMVLQGAWRVITKPTVAGVLDTIRTRVLSFALDLEAEAPDAGETPAGAEPRVPPERVSKILYQTIFAGGNQTVAIGGSGVIQAPTYVVLPGDRESLRAALAGLGLGDNDLAGLERAIAEDPPAAETGAIGPGTRQWIAEAASRVAALAAEGAVSWGAGEAADALVGFVRGFLGV